MVKDTILILDAILGYKMDSLSALWVSNMLFMSCFWLNAVAMGRLCGTMARSCVQLYREFIILLI